eukprot:363782-Chlamydomonas_euryale.AAC.5
MLVRTTFMSPAVHFVHQPTHLEVLVELDLAGHDVLCERDVPVPGGAACEPTSPEQRMRAALSAQDARARLSAQRARARMAAVTDRLVLRMSSGHGVEQFKLLQANSSPGQTRPWSDGSARQAPKGIVEHTDTLHPTFSPFPPKADAVCKPHTKGACGWQPHTKGARGWQPHTKGSSGWQPHTKGSSGWQPHTNGTSGWHPHTKGTSS